jgi:hypothetical protein
LYAPTSAIGDWSRDQADHAATIVLIAHHTGHEVMGMLPGSG